MIFIYIMRFTVEPSLRLITDVDEIGSIFRITGLAHMKKCDTQDDSQDVNDD